MSHDFNLDGLLNYDDDQAVSPDTIISEFGIWTYAHCVIKFGQLSIYHISCLRVEFGRVFKSQVY